MPPKTPRARKKPRGKRIAPALGAWLQYLRGQTGLNQKEAAPEIGITLDALRRIERGENIGIELLLPFLAWLEDVLGAKDLDRHAELVSGLLTHLVETGMKLRPAKPKEGTPSQPAAIDERVRTKPTAAMPRRARR